jgi:quercetin dioxygenase-like cupin family protein
MVDENLIGVTVVQPGEGEYVALPGFGAVFKLSSRTNGGEVSIVEHPFQVALLTAAHRHTREEEHSIVLAGQIGFRSDDSEVVLGPGGYITKPRGQMHAMWNRQRARPHRRDHHAGRVRELFSGAGRAARRARRRSGRQGSARAARIWRAGQQVWADLRITGLDGRHQATLWTEPAFALNQEMEARPGC